MHNYSKILQNKCHLELSENQAVWKPDNQGFEEATFIQMGRRGGVADMGRDGRGGVAGRAVAAAAAVEWLRGIPWN